MSKEKFTPPVIRSQQNRQIKELKSIRQDPKARKTFNQIALFDRKAIQDLPNPIVKLFVTDKKDLGIRAAEKFFVTPEVFYKASGLKTQRGIAAIYDLPKIGQQWPDRILVLDHVTDPGNVGTMIRSAKAFDFGGVILLGSSCDPFNDKALRASKGLTLNFWIQKMTLKAFLCQIQPLEYALYVADAKGAKGICKEQKIALVLGHEGAGVSEELKNQGKKIAIRMNPQVESLNVAVAGSILMHQVRYG